MEQKIQLYSMATPNGQKVGIALEEMELAYDAHLVNIMKGDQHSEEFLALNPNGKIPAIVDPKGPGGQLITLFESGAILVYLAEKTGKFLPAMETSRYITLQWLFFQMGQVGPMFGQFGHFFAHAGKEKCEHPYPKERYQEIVSHTLGVLEGQLKQHPYLAGAEYTIADMATFPWVACLEEFYHAGEALKLKEYPAVQAWLNTCLERPAVQRGRGVCWPEM